MKHIQYTRAIPGAEQAESYTGDQDMQRQVSNIYNILEPYPGQGRECLTQEMERQVSNIYNKLEPFPAMSGRVSNRICNDR